MTSQRPEWSEEQHVYAASGGEERWRAACICSQWRRREAKSSVYMQPVEAKSSVYMQPMEAKSSVYASNECGVLIFKGSSPSYNEQGRYESQIPSHTTSKDLEKQWSIAAWEIHACWSFKFFGGVSKSHCDWSDHSPLRIHLYAFTTSSPSTLKVSQLYIHLLYKFECSPQAILSSDSPIVQRSLQF